VTEPIIWKSLAAAIDGADASAEEASGAEREGWGALAGWLRELWARRVAMGREPGDERNAAADMCSCNIFGAGADECLVHPTGRAVDVLDVAQQAAAEMRTDGVEVSSGRAASCFDAGAVYAKRPPGWRPKPGFMPRPEPKTAQPVQMLSSGDDEPGAGGWRPDAEERLNELEKSGRPFSLLDVAAAAVEPGSKGGGG
jgi:hypothetical protein